MAGPAILRLVNVTVNYGTRRAVNSLSLEVHAGEILGLLGPNGSGKSTTMAVCAGILEPRSGSVEINGLTPKINRSAYAQCIGFVPQEIALYDELSVQDNLRFFGRLFGVHGKQLTARCEYAAELVGLSDRFQCRVGTLSGGMQRRVNLACALIHEPAVILLDEPTAALDPASRELLYETLTRLRLAGRAILFTTHHLDEAEQWCNRIAVLRQGNLTALGRPEELGRRSAKMTILGRLREELSENTEQTIRERLGLNAEFAIDGCHFELIGTDAEVIGISLAVIQSEGAEVESIRTPTTRLEELFEENPRYTPVPAFAKES